MSAPLHTFAANGRGTADCLLLGGDTCHSTEHSFPGLLPACTAAGLSVMYLGKGPQFNAAKLEGIRVVIIFADGYSDEWPGLALGPSWMQPEQEQALEDFVAAGGSFMPLHNSMWGYPIGVHPKHDEATLAAMAAELTEVSGKLRDSTKPTTTVEVGLGDEAKMGPYRRVCGGVGGHHPTYELQDVIVLDDTHPITKGVTDFKVYDEQHFTFIDEHRGAQLLLKNRGSNGAESCAGWAYNHGKGRVCYLAPGHVLLRGQYAVDLPEGEPHALEHPMMQKLLHNAVAWLNYKEAEASL